MSDSNIKRGAFISYEQFQMDGTNINGVYNFLESPSGKAAISVILGKLNTVAPTKMEEAAILNAYNAGVRYAIDTLYALSEPPTKIEKSATSVEEKLEQELKERIKRINPTNF